MRVLFLTTRLPVPPWRGDQVRAFHHLRLLAPRHRITLVVFALGRPDPRDIRATEALGVRVAVHRVSAAGVPAVLARSLCDPRPVQALLFHRHHLLRAFARHLVEEAPEIVHAQLLRTAPYARTARLPVVFDLIDALSWNLARRADREPPLRALVLRREAMRLRGYERVLLDSHATCLVVSDRDRQALGAPRVIVAPNGVDLDAFRYTEEGRRVDEIVFAGNLGYFPNIDAAEWLAQDILPRIRAQLPGVRLRVVGARPHRRVRRLAAVPGVEVVGPVERVEAELARASLTLVPMRAGSGIQNKILEAMASGTPVITTPECAAAVAANPGTDCLTATRAADLADHAVALLGDPVRRRVLARTARARVERDWSWERSAGIVEQAWRTAACSG